MVKAKYLRRREAPFLWRRVRPWPQDCQVCHLPMDPFLGFPRPMAATLGHEPPVAWMLRHPDYEGPLVIRPEHWSCNNAKSDRPDWEM